MSAGDSSDAESSDDEKINPMNQLMSALGASAEGDDSSSATEEEEDDLSDDDNMDSEEADQHDGNNSLRVSHNALFHNALLQNSWAA